MKRILVISHDRVGPKMAGPGMRYHQIAQRLSVNHDVTLATFNPEHSQPVKNARYTLTSIKSYDFRQDFDKYDAIIAMALSPDMVEYAKSKNIALIFDLYAPVPVETLIARVFGGYTTPDEAYNYSSLIAQYQSLLNEGDYFVCSNPIQKDMWLGFALSSGATSPVTYKQFPLYEHIGLLPMGINLDELKYNHDLGILSKRIADIKDTDFIIIWTGGIWDWFDAVTPIKAMKKLVDLGHTDIKLVFLGTKHPNEDVPEMKETVAAYQAAKDLGLFNKNVFFLEGWVEYDERLSYLLRADIALYAHKPSIEARYSHRTRVLDHILTCLPTIATRDDYLADIIESERLGIAVEPQDVNQIAGAVKTLYEDRDLLSSIKKNIAVIQEQYTWENSLRDIEAYLNRPFRPRPRGGLPSPQLSKSKNPIIKTAKKILPHRLKTTIKRHLRQQ